MEPGGSLQTDTSGSHSGYHNNPCILGCNIRLLTFVEEEVA